MKRLIPLLAVVMILLFPVHTQAFDEYEGLDDQGNYVAGSTEDIDVHSRIAGGTYTGKVNAWGGISGGTFEGDVYINGNTEVSGGTFKGNVYVYQEGTISDGTFEKDVMVEFGNITGGEFKGYTSLDGGSITGGTFNRLQAFAVSDKSSIGTSVQYCTVTGNFEIPKNPRTDIQPVVVKGVTLRSGCSANIEGLDESAYKDAFSNGTDGNIGVMLTTSPARYMQILQLRQGLFDKLTVAFDANGGTGQMESYWNYVYGSIQLPQCTYTKEGTEFTEWNTMNHGKGTACKANTFYYCGYGGKGKGDTITLYAQWKDGSYGTEVDAKSVTGVSLNKKTAALVKGDKLTLKATIKPSDADNKSLTWSSSNSKVATVSKSGVVKAVKKGKATITVTTTDGNKTATCDITVTNPVKVKSIKFAKKSYSVKKRKSITLKVTIAPKNATNKEVTWKTSDKKIAKIDKNGKVKGLKKGTVTITATTKDGKKTAKCKVIVK